MADGGMSPVGDPSNLSIYSLHGSTNKMVELVSDVSGNMEMLPCQPNGNQGMYPGPNQAALYPVQNDFVSGSYIQVDPLNYGESSSYEAMKLSEEVKRATVPSYYGSTENIQNTDSIYNNHSYGNYQTNQQQILKPEADSMGYIQLLSNTDNLGHEIVIKKEKLDYSDELNMINSQSPDIPYPPNTCISDWNFYNSSINLPSSSENLNQSARNYNTFQVPSVQQHQQQYLTSGSMYENNSHMSQISLGLSNEDIHHQAQKISHELMSSGWNSENLYKPQVYSNVVAVDSLPRKRKPELDKVNRPIKSRKRKPDSMDGHSKTVASILMADNPLPSSSNSGSRSWLDNDVLGSTERNAVLSSLMDNLRSTVQFESFCLSFPRSQGKEDAFRRKIIHTINMINDIPGLTLKSNPIPSEYVSRASKVISSFRSALSTTGNRDETHVLTGDRFHNLRSDQVEEHLPHSMVWAVKLDDHLLTANWEGQFVATVNPVQSILSFSLFQFQPYFSGDGIKCLQNAKLTKSLANDILENMQQFEVSRQLRVDVKLQCITQIYLFMSGLDRDSGCLVLEVGENPVFYQRWIHCSAENKNKWKRRKNFFKSTHSRSGKYIYIGGLMSEISELLALILASSHDLEQLYEQGTRKPLRMDPSNLYTYENGFDALDDGVNVSPEGEGSNGFVKHINRFGNKPKALRDDIIAVLVENEIVKDADSVTIRGLSESNRNGLGDTDGDYCVNLGIHLDRTISECFRDYINYTCHSAIELSRLLASKVNPSSYGFCDSDFDLSLLPGRNIEQLTVGQLISSSCSDVVYFSFCSKQIGQLGHEKHCSKCQTCNTWRFWHCDTCNRCTESGRVCEFCGHLRDDQSRMVIKPLSVFKSQEDSGKLVLEVEKDEWKASLNFPNDDVVSWEFPKLPLMDNTNCVMQYDSTTAMVDQLGLLNPVGFLLGLPAASASRKHRRYKESVSYGKQPDSLLRNAKSGAASACNLQ